MMNDLARKEHPIKMSSHHEPMFEDIPVRSGHRMLGANLDANVSAFVCGTPTAPARAFRASQGSLVLGKAALRTKRLLDPSKLIWLFRDEPTADFTPHDDARNLRHQR